NLILRVAGFDKGDTGFDEAGAFGTYTAAFIHDETYDNGHVGGGEGRNFLRHAVFVDLKLIFVEAGDVAAAWILDAYVEGHELDIGANFEFFLRGDGQAE